MIKIAHRNDFQLVANLNTLTGSHKVARMDTLQLGIVLRNDFSDNTDQHETDSPKCSGFSGIASHKCCQDNEYRIELKRMENRIQKAKSD